MLVNLNEIIGIQKKLDKFIEEKHKLISYDLISKKKLALIVEIAELCNEVRCFKYWSLKPRSDNMIIIDEFVDCLHFILSIGIFYGLKNLSFNIETKNKKNKNDLSIFFIEIISEVNQINSLDNVTEFIKKLFELSYYLNLEINEIIEAYYLKNKVNFIRQEENY